MGMPQGSAVRLPARAKAPAGAVEASGPNAACATRAPADTVPLYEKLVPAPHTMASEQVSAIQRRRLCGAMVHAVAERGYEGAGISYVCALAGVSKRTLYQRFAGKEECFLAAYEQIVGRVLARMNAALDQGEAAGRRARPNECGGWGG